MKRIMTSALAVTTVATFALITSVAASAADKSAPAKAASPKAVPADRVLVMYFHRTQRCPTCLRMGTYSEESVTEKYADAMKAGKVEFHYIDFQDKKNEALTKGYKIAGPTLIVAKVVGNKIKEYTNLKDIWAKNANPKEFHEYVQQNIAAYAK
jgi:hypothetical protein